VKTHQDGVTTLLSEVAVKPVQRIATGPWDICFGPANDRDPNGVAVTSCNLIGGCPGAGKSTFSLQLSDALAKQTDRETLYICAEEDLDQVGDRAYRLGVSSLSKIRGMPTLSNPEALGQLESIILKHKPSAVILDSIEGLMGKDKDGAVELCKIFKGLTSKYRFPSFIIDHVTKVDDFAGLMSLQHAPDGTFTLFPEEQDGNVRVLETQKNRFGRAFVRCRMLMTERGLIAIGDDEEVSHDD